MNMGDRVYSGAPLITLSRLAGRILAVGVEADALAKVKPDQPVHITPLSSDCKLGEGKVKRIASPLVQRPGTCSGKR